MSGSGLEWNVSISECELHQCKVAIAIPNPVSDKIVRRNLLGPAKAGRPNHYGGNYEPRSSYNLGPATRLGAG